MRRNFDEPSLSVLEFRRSRFLDARAARGLCQSENRSGCRFDEVAVTRAIETAAKVEFASIGRFVGTVGFCLLPSPTLAWTVALTFPFRAPGSSPGARRE